ncbi:hypothetical protein [Pseudonocardia alni]|uniref:hypothetical protein n=1 Tax=Pseudonocardia alni TaxID=33907 RepID=UPI0033327E43
MNFARGISVRVHRLAGVDRFGDRLPGTTHVVSGCALAPRTSSEDNPRGSTVIVGLTLYGPYGADIRAEDVVELEGGSRYEVVGEPGHWASPFTGWAPGCEVALERVTG